VFLFRSIRFSIFLALGALIIGISPAVAAPAHHQTSDVYSIDDGTKVNDAAATLTRNDRGVTMRFHTSELDPGATYTIWWIVFNNPEECSHGMGGDILCGEGDLLLFGGDEAVHSSVLFAAGHVVGKNGVGNFAGRLNVSNPSGEVLFGPGLMNARDAEIHLVIRTHGDPIPGMVPEQIHTFAGGCDVNDCIDQQFAAFPAQ
jgi:hypothetical protein